MARRPIVPRGSGWSPTRTASTAAARRDLLAILSDSIERGGEFVRRRVDAGDPGFVKMWNDMGGAERFDRRRRWWAEHRDVFADALR